MVAENTNPEFIYAFYKAQFIAVETNSELSHAAITCKELDIPLAL
jgi:phosphohistidine swiveling domain-containing protein